MPDSAVRTVSGAGRGFFRELASGRSDLLEAIMRFNAKGAKGAQGAPESGDASPGVDALLDSSARGRQVRLRLGGERGGFWNFEEESTRLALVEPEVLESLALHFGAAVNARSFAAVVRRDELAELSAAVGSGLIDYALGRGSFHLGETRTHFLALHTAEPLARRVRLHGTEALGICAGRWPEALRALAGRRFPGLLDKALQPPERDRKLERLVWFGLKKLLTKEVAPQWAPCFS